ncbi:MAG: glycosyltransferase, partial [Puniceicoccales bacterium]
ISDESLIARFTPSDNLQITRWVPQLALLRRAAVMVTHGGLNSIMECVNLSVPMVILPCQRDQPGNAARAAYHHLGLVSDPAHLTPAKLLAQISTAMSSEDLRSGIETMKAKIQEEDGMQNAIEFIRSHLPLSGPQTHPQLQENTP